MAAGRSRPVDGLRAPPLTAGAKGRNDRIFLEALHDFAVHNITWRALPEAFGIWIGDRWRSPTEGQASDSPQFEVLLDLGPDITPRAAVGDKGYDGQSNRTAARERGICPVIPFKLWPETGQLSFRRRFTGRAPASSSWPASSSASSASPSVARKRTRTSALSSLSPSASSSSNPSTGPRIGSSMCTLVDRIDV